MSTAQLLKRRTPVPGAQKLVKVTDGASKNFSHQHSESLVEASCNAHAFLKFHDLKDYAEGRIMPIPRIVESALSSEKLTASGLPRAA